MSVCVRCAGHGALDTTAGAGGDWTGARLANGAAAGARSRGRRGSGRSGLRALARHDRFLHLVEQSLSVEGLVGEVVDPRLAAARGVVGVVAARERHDRDSGVARPDGSREGVTVFAAERHVDDDGSGLLAQEREGVGGVLGGDHPEVIAPESDLESLSHGGAVVDGQQGLGHVGSLRSA